MKKERDCGMGVPHYNAMPMMPGMQGMPGMMPSPMMPAMQGMPGMPGMGNYPQTVTTINANTNEDDINRLEQRINMLERRIANLEGNNNFNAYNSNSYQML